MAPQTQKYEFERISSEPILASKFHHSNGLKQLEKDEIEQAHLSWIKAIQLDRSHLAPYMELSKLYESIGESESKDIIDSEIRRLKNESSQLSTLPGSDYFNEVTAITSEGAAPLIKRKILIITNLFPPQEMGGFGKTMWEFSNGLLQKGHQVKILTSDSAYLDKSTGPESLSIEKQVSRCFDLFGHWKKGIVEVDKDENVITEKAVQNHLKIRHEVESFQPDACIIGNIDLIGHAFIHEILGKNIPVIHRLGNKAPGYPVNESPNHSKFCLAAASEWLVKSLKDEKYPIQNFEILHPGSPLNQYYRHILPDFSKLRIAYASILAPFKGFHVLVDALALLKKNNIPFECHAMGNNTHESYFNEIIEFVKKRGLDDQIHFYGYQPRDAMVRMFDQCNTLVFPTVFEEPFGKSQIEAMASGLTVVSSATGGAAEIMQNEVNGLTFKNGDVQELANKLYFLSKHPEHAAQLARNGQISSIRYATTQSVSKLETIIEKMLTQ